MNVEKYILHKAKNKNFTIIFPEAGFSDRIIKATKIISKKKIAKIILVGDESSLVMRFKNLKKFNIVNPKSSELSSQFAQKLYEYRKDKGMTLEQAQELVLDPFYFSAMMVKEGYADGMVGGAEVSTSKNLKPALQIIKAKEGLASSCFVIAGKHKNIKLPIFLTDAGLNENPTSQQLAIIAKQTVDTAKSMLGSDIKVAFLSYSTKGSAESEMTQKVKDAYQTFANTNPEILCDGELQLDSALIERVAKLKCPQSPVAGKANVLVVPDLNAGNILYKCMQYFGGLTAIGPIVQGLNKPVNDLSRGCSIKDIVLLTAVTVLQCENNKNNKENKQ